jgi:hypothetical protein
VPGQSPDSVDIGLLRLPGQPTQLHIFDHTLSLGGH